MLPTNTSHNSTNVISVGSEAFGYFSLLHTISGKLSNLTHFVFCQCRKRVFFSEITSALFCHIGHVLSMRSKKQMVWVYAGRIIAGMKNILPFGKNDAMRYFPQEMMGKYNAFAIPGTSITFFIPGARPEPTWSIHRHSVPGTWYHCKEEMCQ